VTDRRNADALRAHQAVLTYGPIDADNHRTETEDGYLRYIELESRDNAPRWNIPQDTGRRPVGRR
jgi:hypothetical protein